MDGVDRRRFLEGSAAVAAGLSLAQAAAADETPATGEGKLAPPPQIDLGTTGIRMSRLGQGTGVSGGNRQSNQTRAGFAHLVELFLHAFDRGITFYDMADLYGTHVYFREALRSLPREQLTLLTKVWWRYDGPEDKTADDIRGQMVRTTIERFRHELSTDRLDIVLLHCLMKSDWPQHMQPYMDALHAEKEKGRIRALGVSCHDFGALKTAAAEPWVDVILARINPDGAKMDASPAEIVEVLTQAKANGKAIIGMKIFGEGTLAHKREACIEFAQQQPFMDAMTIGFEQKEQIDDVLRLMAKYPVKG